MEERKKISPRLDHFGSDDIDDGALVYFFFFFFYLWANRNLLSFVSSYRSKGRGIERQSSSLTFLCIKGQIRRELYTIYPKRRENRKSPHPRVYTNEIECGKRGTRASISYHESRFQCIRGNKASAESDLRFASSRGSQSSKPVISLSHSSPSRIKRSYLSEDCLVWCTKARGWYSPSRKKWMVDWLFPLALSNSACTQQHWACKHICCSSSTVRVRGRQIKQ